MEVKETPELDRTLGPVMLWGLGVGYVISGMYFGWNLGLPAGGTLGLAIATLFIMIMYVCFTFSYAELACSIPKAGGAFDYARTAFGPAGGFITGMAQNIEFVFAPPAIAFAIAAYLQTWMPNFSIIGIAISCYLIFTLINIVGVKTAAIFELLITIIAVFELLLFTGIALPHFEFQNLTINAFPNGISGIFAAIPFAIWFFLAIEGVANVAEETINPQRNILIGLGSAMLTLAILCVLVFASSIGVAGWEGVVYEAGSTVPSDSPLPLALAHIVGKDSLLMHFLIGIGIFGLVASFHGIILVAGRATYEFAKVGHGPKFMSKIHPKFKTPANALIVNMFLGIAALLTGKTGEIITIACFGALVLYIMSMLSVFKLRKTHADMERPFKVPFYPFSPAIACFIATFSLIAMSYYNQLLGGIFYGVMVVSFIGFKVFDKSQK